MRLHNPQKKGSETRYACTLCNELLTETGAKNIQFIINFYIF